MSDGRTLAEWAFGALASATAALATWGAIGGATNALVTEMDWRDMIRHIIIGAMVAAGAGGVGAELFAHYTGAPGEVFRTGAAAGPVAYLTGVFGPALIELALAKIRKRNGSAQDSGTGDQNPGQ